MPPEQFFEAMYLKHSESMLRVAISMVRDYSLAEEIVNETFLVLWMHIHRVMKHDNPTRWLYIVLRRNAIDEVRKNKKRAEVPLNEAISKSTNADFFAFPDLLPTALSDEDKQLLIWRYERGMGYDEMARCLSISDAACRMRVKRARERCAQLLHSQQKNDAI